MSSRVEKLSEQEGAGAMIDRAEVTAFVSDIVAHQAALLPEAEMQAWREWLSDLTENQYPGLA